MLNGQSEVKLCLLFFRKVDHSLLAGHVFLNGEKVVKKSRPVCFITSFLLYIYIYIYNKITIFSIQWSHIKMIVR